MKCAKCDCKENDSGECRCPAIAGPAGMMDTLYKATGRDGYSVSGCSEYIQKRKDKGND